MGITISGGDKLEAKLREIAEEAAKAKTVRVGFLEGATYPNGMPVAQVAAINEYGGTVTVPEHDVTVNRKVKSNGEFAKNGRFVKESEANFQTVHHVESYTVTIPARPYFRGMVQQNKGEWGPALGTIIKAADYDSAVALGRLGSMVRDQLQDSIREFSEPENAKSTVRKKGFNDPLVDSSHMLNSADFEVNE
ncbi:hypothetical protein [Paraburkholderia unamae]|uniref:HK97 gp10 family phage protein n=1 Tax=Paraburkholderia unamae TaxID=219649 RepID=A0ABX5K8U4_9BURK|nr:hypothetical protein [Paraburkholderia unamae]PVX61240.1 hypothetical protein C7402_14231 [Paraburkholderia unamae]